MSKSNGNGKSLRFAALIRVSTEKQERKGESLRTQAVQIGQSVQSMGGRIVARYAGQEHATAGWERAQLSKLLADAAKPHRSFDAVMVADATRWSRDNVASDTGLETLRDCGVRFFVLGTEYDLFNPEARMFLRMSATIGAYHAHSQNKKSIENRIERAKRGVPTCGKLPFGRVWDDAQEAWRLDETKQAMIADVAKRYLAGESLQRLAKEYRVNYANLCKTLRERCGDKWLIAFSAAELNIHETVTLEIPRLLPEATIRAIRLRLQGNRTYLHKPARSKHDYILAGRVFCAACGFNFMGQLNAGKRRYYRHAHHERALTCPLSSPRPWIRADKIEAEIIRKVFDTLGNPAAIERAVKAAVPNCDKALEQTAHVEAELAKIDRARKRVLDLIDKDAVTDAQAETKLRELKERETSLRIELDHLAATMPNAKKTFRLSVHILEGDAADGIIIEDEHGNTYAGGNDVASFLVMTKEDRRKLIETAFSGHLPDGKPTGVYLTPIGGDRHGPKRFNYQLRGKLLAREAYGERGVIRYASS